MSLNEVIATSLSWVPPLLQRKTKVVDPRFLIQNILAVGALYKSCEASDYLPRDQWSIEKARQIARRQGFTNASDGKVSIANLAYGTDFLAPTFRAQADMIVVCNVYHPRQKPFPGSPALLMAGVNPDLRVSPYHFDPGAWSRAAARTGAKVIVTINNADDCKEVTVDHFKEAAFTEGRKLTCNYTHGSQGLFRVSVRSLVRPDLMPTARRSRKYAIA